MNKWLSILLLLFLAIETQAALPPTRAAGLDQTLGVGFNLRTYGSGVTDLGGINKLFEGKAEPLLPNPSFETLLGSDSWTYTPSGADTFAIENGTVIEGSQSALLSPAAETFTFDQVISIDQYDGKVVGFSCEINSTENVDVCFMEGTTELSCTTKNKADKWVKSEVLGSVISGNTYGIRIKSDVAITDNVYIDKCEFTSNPLNFKDGVKYQQLRFDGTAASLSNGTDEFQWTSPTSVFTSSGTDQGLLSIVDNGANTRTEFVANKRLKITAVMDTAMTVGGGFATVWKNATIQNRGTYAAAAGERAGVSSTFLMEAGDYLALGLPSRTVTGGSELKVTIVAEAVNSQIIEQADIVSSDNIAFNFKSTAIDCDVDPIGTYNTYSKAASSNNFTICATAPTFTPNNTDGIKITAVGYGSARACSAVAAESRVDICVGKGFKGLKVLGYQNTNRGGESLDTVHITTGGTEYGIDKFYNEKTGVLSLSTLASTSANTTRKFQAYSAVYNDGYFHFALSKNPVVNAIDAVPRVDYSWENDFSARINGVGTCAVLSENSNFIDSCTRISAGRYQIDFNSGFFTQVPSIKTQVVLTNILTGIVETSPTSSQAIVQVFNTNTNANVDATFDIQVQRQGSDYRSRGDAAAILSSSESCILKDKRPDDVPAGSSSANTWHTRVFDSELEGNCYFLTRGPLTADANMNSGSRFSDFTLEKGTYYIEGYAPAFDAENHKTRLRNTTDSTDDVIGQSAYAAATFDAQTNSPIDGVVTITDSKTFELLHFIEFARATNGLGLDTQTNALSGISTIETYTTLKIKKVK